METHSGSHCPFELLPYGLQPKSAAGLASLNRETGLEILRLRQKEKIQKFKLKELKKWNPVCKNIEKEDIAIFTCIFSRF